MKPSRNDVCPCGSNKKFKKCCIDKPEFNVPTEVANLVANPTQAEQNGIVSLYSAGRFDEMESQMRLLLGHYPNSGWAWKAWGTALERGGKDGLAALQKSAELAPKNAETHNLISVALHLRGKTDEAITCVQKALRINPDYPEALVTRGSYYIQSGRMADAEVDLRRAIRFKPGLSEAHLNISNVFYAHHRLADAQTSARRALQLQPNSSKAYANLGQILRALGQVDEAMLCVEKALHLDPKNAEAYNTLGLILSHLGRRAESETAHRKSIEVNSDNASYYGNLLYSLNYHADDSVEAIAELTKQYNRKFCMPHEGKWPEHANRAEPEKRLRIGYVSPDFRHHAVAYFMEPVIVAHDADQVEVFCYAQVDVEDDYTKKFRRLADHWISTVGLSDEAVSQMIVDHQIDILVDLAGHTRGNRLLVFARKPAPIQLTYLGYPGTTGVGAIDYRITDVYASPLGAETEYSESLLRLPHSAWCFTPAIGMPDPSVLPALANGHITFGSLNSFDKIDQPTLELWAGLLNAIPSARLMMLTVPEGEARVQLIKKFAELGVSDDRLELHGKLSQAGFHRKFLEVDVSLDPLNMNGATTTCESLWMGVPVISLIGERFLNRAGFSILSTAGIAEYAATTADEYIEIAARLASNLPQLAKTRANLRARLSDSPLTDAAAFTHSIEGVYRRLWRDWCVRRDQTRVTSRHECNQRSTPGLCR